MDYTNEQYTLMKKLSSGISYCELSVADRKILLYLDSEKVAEPNAQFQDNWWTLTPDGERILAAHTEKLLIRAENIRREEEQEQKRLDQAVADKVDRKAEKRSDRVFQVFLVVLGYILGLATPYIPTIVGTICESVQLFVRWIASIV